MNSKPLITLFTMPKSFSDPSDHTTIIQTNAIRSWARLSPHVQVVLVGSEPGIADAAARLGVQHSDRLQYNEHGTPLVNSAFETVRAMSKTTLLAYCNSDVILTDDFVATMQRLNDLKQGKPFVAFGRRIDLKVETEIDFDSANNLNDLVGRAKSQGRIVSQVCKEYFVFPRSVYQSIPPFAIGRGNWDNWMIHSAKQNATPVINVSHSVTAIHQLHNYMHAKTNRRNVYMTGSEAKENQRLAGGRHWVSGSVGSHRLTPGGIEREKMLLLNPHFWADVPRFLRLAKNLVISQ